MKVRHLLLVLAASSGSFSLSSATAAPEKTADMASEIGTSTALVQARIGDAERRTAGIGDTVNGWARFEAADNENFVRPIVSEWEMIRPENDYVVKFMLGKIRGGRDRTNELQSGKEYFWRVRYGPTTNPAKLVNSSIHTFKTLSGTLASSNVRFAVVQGIDASAPNAAAALAAVAATHPDYVVFNGNSVSYDRPANNVATTDDAMRARWHALLSQPTLVNLLQHTGSFWLKNDHDFRFSNADSSGSEPPTAELGAAIFREQVPIIDPRDTSSLSFRVAQATRDLALWMLEVRDYRTPDSAPDNEDKHLWGTSQAEWVQRSLAFSTTPFKVLIQPTPIVGPTFASSDDSHASIHGFRTERQHFLDNVKSAHLAEKGLIILTGADWQYDAIAPDGLEEISIGSLTSPLQGAVPVAGSPASSDPTGAIKQPFCPAQATAGFALIEITAATESVPAKMTISLIRADTGAVVHTVTRTGPKP